MSSKSEDIHVVPTFDDEPKHDSTPDCWCGPQQDAENARDEAIGVAKCKVWVHNRRGYQ